MALIYDLQNEWALDLAQLPRSEDKNYQERCIAHYRPFWQQGITLDIINSTYNELSNYKLLIAPMLYMLQDGVAEQLSDFVAAGGTLVATYLTGLVNQSDLVFLDGTLGPLQELLGIGIVETDVLFDHDQQSIQPTEVRFSRTNYPIIKYADIVRLQGAEALAIYEQDFYAGSPALTVNKFGRGQAYYLAARFNDQFLTDFYGWLGQKLNLETAVTQPLPSGVTAQVRPTDTEKFIFLLNFKPTPQIVRIDEPAIVDAISGQTIAAEIALAGYGWRILKQSI